MNAWLRGDKAMTLDETAKSQVQTALKHADVVFLIDRHGFEARDLVFKEWRK
jgi:hypothetical protein